MTFQFPQLFSISRQSEDSSVLIMSTSTAAAVRRKKKHKHCIISIVYQYSTDLRIRDKRLKFDRPRDMHFVQVSLFYFPCSLRRWGSTSSRIRPGMSRSRPRRHERKEAKATTCTLLPWRHYWEEARAWQPFGIFYRRVAIAAAACTFCERNDSSRFRMID